MLASGGAGDTVSVEYFYTRITIPGFVDLFFYFNFGVWDGKDGMSGISKCGYSKVWVLSHLILAFWFFTLHLFL